MSEERKETGKSNKRKSDVSISNGKFSIFKNNDFGKKAKIEIDLLNPQEVLNPLERLDENFDVDNTLNPPEVLDENSTSMSQSKLEELLFGSSDKNIFENDGDDTLNPPEEIYGNAPSMSESEQEEFLFGSNNPMN